MISPTSVLPRETTATRVLEVADLSANPDFSRRTLTWAGRLWFGVVVLGQLMFVAYLLAFYGRYGMAGDFEAWNRVVPHAHRAGDALGNTAMALHVALAALVIAGGLLQLLPWLRRRLAGLHRWNGRVYMLGALAASGAGLYMVWIRGAVGDMGQHLGLTLNAVLIWGFVALAWRAARRGQFVEHRRWAMRLFMVVSGVWFFRVGLMFWILVNGGPVGFDPDSFTGPFLTTLAFVDYLLPLAVLELYFFAESQAGVKVRLAVATLLAGLSVAIGVGATMAAMAMWFPRMVG